MNIVFVYDEALNPQGKIIPGIGNKDISDDQFEALPEYLRASVTAAPFFVPVILTESEFEEEE